VGHCPHDEAPERVNPLIVEFMQRVAQKGKGKGLGAVAVATQEA